MTGYSARKALFLSVTVGMFAEGISILSGRWSDKAVVMLVVLYKDPRARRTCEVSPVLMEFQG